MFRAARNSIVFLTLILSALAASTIKPAHTLKSSTLSAPPATPTLGGRPKARLAQAATGSVAVHAAGRGNPWINFRDGVEVPTSYVGPDDLLQVLVSGDARPLSMASADFDGDGAPDLACGYTAYGMGIMTLYRGNIKSRSADATTTSDPTQDGEAPFLSQAQVIALPDIPDFLCAGDFDADGHADIVVAARGSKTLYLLSGNDRGDFAQALPIELAAEITAVTAHRGDKGEVSDLAVAIRLGDESKILMFAGSQGALKARPSEIPLPAPSTALAFGQFYSDADIGIAAIAGTDLIVATSRDSWAESGSPKISQRSFPFLLRSIAVGHFNDEESVDIALLAIDGRVYTLTKARKPGKKNSIETWKEKSVEVGNWPQAAGLMRARLTESPIDDLVVLDSANHQLDVGSLADQVESTDVSRFVELDVDGEPVALLPMELNAKGIEDLVLLITGRSSPVVVPSAVHIAGSDTVPGVYSITNTGTPSQVAPGGDITYTMVVRNLSSTPLDVFFSDSDNQGPNTTAVVTPPPGWTQQPAPSGQIKYGIVNWPPNSAQTFTIKVHVGTNVSGGTVIINTAILSCGQAPALAQKPSVACFARDAVAQENTTVVAPAVLVITKTASAGTIAAGSDVTYTLTVTNQGQATASSITVQDPLDSNLTYKSCTSPGGCTQLSSNTVQANFGSVTLPPGVSQTFTITATVNCNAPTGQITNTATVIYNNGQIPNASFNSTPAMINVSNTGAGLRLSPSSNTTLGFGTVSLNSSTSSDFSVENTGAGTCPATFTLSSLLRTGPDVSRISNKADTGFFKVTRTDGTTVNIGQAVQLAPGTTTFRVVFTPSAPARPGTNTNLLASQVLPVNLTSQLSISGIATPLTLNASVPRTVKIIGGVSLRVTGDTFEVDLDVYSPDWADVNTLSVRLVDPQGNTLAQNTASVASAIAAANLVKGQTFGLVQTGSGVSDKQIARAEVTVSGAGGSDVKSSSVNAIASKSPAQSVSATSMVAFSEVRATK